MKIYVDYNKVNSDTDSLKMFKGEPETDYPFTKPPTCMHEQNFVDVEHQIERVDFNFFDEYLLGNSLKKEQMDQHDLDILCKVQM